MHIYKNKNKISSYTLIGFFMFLAIFFKEFYLRRSGVIQLGDIFYIISFLLVIFNTGSIKINEYDINLIIFIGLSIFINFIYTIIYNSYDFLIYSAYMIFSLMIVFLARNIQNERIILEFILASSKVVIITQVLIALFDGGGYLFGRYTGTFNDPNQFAYYAFSMFLLIYILKEILDKKHNLIWIIFTIYLIHLSESTSMVLGMIVFLAIYLIFNIINNISKNSTYSKVLVGSIIFITIVVIMTMYFKYIDQRIINNRVISKLTRINGMKDLLLSFINDRAMNRIIKDPLVFLYGSGEGMWTRYSQINEIHSTILGLMYYYGIIPFIFFVKWLYKNFSKLDKKMWCAYFPFIFVAFTLANHRQPTFWIIIVLASNISLKRDVL